MDVVHVAEPLSRSCFAQLVVPHPMFLCDRVFMENGFAPWSMCANSTVNVSRCDSLSHKQ
ncbi:hypothetical protein KIN20_019309 [Parelaphostrongylus tenuis]|uniref:Uncharacterized protein n=1 Tax=Parelaphostrongylus tenuis TaxID=148309 RepID=A0AAD5QV01_PARTN|nr:hypothetical protein KIN20_019309 [Parelaphostrongylus tenuis]